MSNNNVLNFVKMFWPERLSNWQLLDEEKAKSLSRSKIISEYNINLILHPQENEKEVNGLKSKMNEVQQMLDYSECSYDVFVFNNFYEKYRRFEEYCFNEKYNFIFLTPEKYSVEVKPLKSLQSYLKRILELLPEYYTQKNKEYENLFGRFVIHLESVSFQSQTENVYFQREQLPLIPYFIKYRDENLFRWFYEYELPDVECNEFDKLKYNLRKSITDYKSTFGGE